MPWLQTMQYFKKKLSLLNVPLGKRQKENTGNVLKFIQVQLTCSNFDCLNLIAASTKYGSNSSILISFKWDSSWSWMPLSFLVTNARQMPNMEPKSQRHFDKYLPRAVGHDQLLRRSSLRLTRLSLMTVTVRR